MKFSIHICLNCKIKKKYSLARCSPLQTKGLFESTQLQEKQLHSNSTTPLHSTPAILLHHIWGSCAPQILQAHFLPPYAVHCASSSPLSPPFLTPLPCGPHLIFYLQTVSASPASYRKHSTSPPRPRRPHCRSALALDVRVIRVSKNATRN